MEASYKDNLLEDNNSKKTAFFDRSSTIRDGLKLRTSNQAANNNNDAELGATAAEEEI